ncbi:hypothetical protein [Marinifilum sp. D714]|uniref:hypothetical protein n=1 Tax=Marinifilum sp. D714 TaxID=2937523 RepID=UPI0027D1BA76|nr:hypothetical protein [Marinifilum sp. D714]MDQ2178883.1 hypothetical protein [Marinifilum sp. D714]
MEKAYKSLGILLVIFGVISMLLLLAKGFNFYQLENRYLFGALVFVAITFPAFGIKLLRKNKL